jgi:glutathione S-transferase
MILIGQYDSPFVRRVAIAMRMYGMGYEHWPWSTFADAEKIARYNPLRRVPTLVLDDQSAVIESGAILDYLDETADPAKLLIARDGLARRRALRVCALATGLADKAVTLVYERVLHPQTSQAWVERCRSQIDGVLTVLEAERGYTPFWFGAAPGHADIAVACALRFTSEAHPGAIDLKRWPKLAHHVADCEGLEPFRAISQPFTPPKGNE